MLLPYLRTLRVKDAHGRGSEETRAAGRVTVLDSPGRRRQGKGGPAAGARRVWGPACKLAPALQSSYHERMTAPVVTAELMAPAAAVAAPAAPAPGLPAWEAHWRCAALRWKPCASRKRFTRHLLSNGASRAS